MLRDCPCILACVFASPQAMGHVEPRDELFMQLLKQTRSNGGVAALRAWELLLLVSCTMGPSREYK